MQGVTNLSTIFDVGVHRKSQSAQVTRIQILERSGRGNDFHLAFCVSAATASVCKSPSSENHSAARGPVMPAGRTPGAPGVVVFPIGGKALLGALGMDHA